MTHLFVGVFSIPGPCRLSESFFRLLHVSKNFSNTLAEKNPRVRGLCGSNTLFEGHHSCCEEAVCLDRTVIMLSEGGQTSEAHSTRPHLPESPANVKLLSRQEGVVVVWCGEGSGVDRRTRGVLDKYVHRVDCGGSSGYRCMSKLIKPHI